MKRRWCLMAVVGLLTSCSHCKTVTPCDFSCVWIGEPEETVMEDLGTPYEIVECADGTTQYVYIVRQNRGTDIRVQQHYIVEVQEGVVTDKWSELQEDCPFHHFDHHHYHRRRGW